MGPFGNGLCGVARGRGLCQRLLEVLQLLTHCRNVRLTSRGTASKRLDLLFVMLLLLLALLLGRGHCSLGGGVCGGRRRFEELLSQGNNSARERLNFPLERFPAASGLVKLGKQHIVALLQRGRAAGLGGQAALQRGNGSRVGGAGGLGLGQEVHQKGVVCAMGAAGEARLGCSSERRVSRQKPRALCVQRR